MIIWLSLGKKRGSTKFVPYENVFCKWLVLYTNGRAFSILCVCVCTCAHACIYLPKHGTLTSILLILGHRFTDVSSQSNLIYPKPLVLQLVNTENESWEVTCPRSCNASVIKPGLGYKSPDYQSYTVSSPT